MTILQKELNPRHIHLFEIVLTLIFSFFPLLLDYPYRVNIFVTYEGAYRMFLGQVPFRDFGLPLGYGFWIAPWLAFKLFGPYMFSLIIIQGFINFFSILAFRGILKIFGLSPIQILLSVIVFCLSFILVNFWPWYNHTAFVYELIGLYFLIRYLLKDKNIVFILLSAFFIALCFLTKQDAGGLGITLSIILLAFYGLLNKSFKPILLFVAFYAASMGLLILPFLRYDFSYWFNHGQPPHFSRINLYDFLVTFFEESLWIKFYIAAVILITIARFKTFKELFQQQHYVIFSLFTLGILGQAMIIQVTSFSPPTTTFYLHSFAFAFLIYNLGAIVKLERFGIAVVAVLLIFFWRSENYFKYSLKALGKFLPASFAPPPPNVISKNTWAAKADTVKTEPVIWQYSKYRSLKKIKLPTKTIEGLERLEALDIVKNNSSLRCLNLSNLTFLAHELKYVPDHGENFPLWYHKGVAFFDREAEMLCHKIESHQYDIVLFEVMPDVDNFFPFDVRACLQKNYTMADKFLAPTGYTTDFVEVYIRPH
jgi:hypothetical protein